jgi:hypothetical protein
VFQKAAGLANRESRTPNTLDTTFRNGSMNKMFTATRGRIVTCASSRSPGTWSSRSATSIRRPRRGWLTSIVARLPLESGGAAPRSVTVVDDFESGTLAGWTLDRRGNGNSPAR